MNEQLLRVGRVFYRFQNDVTEIDIQISDVLKAPHLREEECEEEHFVNRHGVPPDGISLHETQREKEKPPRGIRAGRIASDGRHRSKKGMRDSANAVAPVILIGKLAGS